MYPHYITSNIKTHHFHELSPLVSIKFDDFCYYVLREVAFCCSYDDHRTDFIQLLFRVLTQSSDDWLHLLEFVRR